MKPQFIFLDKETIKKLITEKEKKDRYRIDEFVISIMLCNFCEKSWKTECAIGFPLKESEAYSVPLVGSGNIKELKEIINKTESDNDIDVLITKHEPNNPNRTGQAFQIKNFDYHQPVKTTEGLIDFIKNLKYSKTETALVVHIATGEPTGFTKIKEAINFEYFPFSALYCVGVYGNILRLFEIWPRPNIGKEELDWLSL
jgi:hypothetical protein